MSDLSRLCIHTATTKPWSVEIAIEQYARAGVAGITVWRDALSDRDPAAVGRRIRDAGLEAVSLCRGGFFAAVERETRRRAVEENLRAVEEAAALGAPVVVLVCGADSGQALETSRRQIVEGIGAISARAREAGVRLAVEPLHPMYADEKSAISTMQSANDICDEISAQNVGVAVDVYHIWWDPNAPAEIRRCGAAGRLFAFHVCDWRVPTGDLLLDRALMGEGCIDVPRFRRIVEESGFEGYHEVEIFSTRYWSMDQSNYLDQIIEAYRRQV